MIQQRSAGQRLGTVIKYLLGAILCVAIGAGASIYYHLKLHPATSPSTTTSVPTTPTTATSSTDTSASPASGPNLNDALSSVDASLSGADTSAAAATNAPADSDTTP